MDDEKDGSDRRRLKLELKRANERTKLSATFLNGIGIAAIVVGIIAPLANGSHFGFLQSVTSSMAALAFHGSARILLRWLKDEEV